MKRILIIDDDDASIELVRSAMPPDEVRVVATTDPRHTEAILEARAIDLVLLDVRMPHISGIDVLRNLRQDRRWQQLPILALSGDSGTETKLACFQAGADDYVVKPFDNVELAARVDRFLTRTGSVADLSGRLGKLAIADLFQSIAQGALTGSLWLVHRTHTAQVEWQGGKVIDGTVGTLTGREAMLELSTWQHGRFSFEAQDAGPEIKPAKNALNVSKVLLEATWLEDELDNRSSLVPQQHAGLSEGHGAELSRIDEAFRHLPFGLVLDRLKERPGITLSDLASGLALAPLKVRLMIAVLVEHGGIAVGAPREPGTVDRPRNDVGLSVASLVSTLRGEERQSAYLSLHVERQTWPLARKLIEALPTAVAGTSHAAFFAQVEAREPAVLPLFEGDVRIALSVSMLDEDDRAASHDHLLAVADALVLWLGPDSGTDAIKQYLRSLKALASETVQLAVVPKARASADALLLQAFGTWRIISQSPTTLWQLFADIAA